MKTKVRLKEDLRTLQDLVGAITIMKQLAANRLQQLETLQTSFDDLTNALQEFFYWMDTEEIKHPFFKRQLPAQLILLITTDMGFLGGLNTAVIQEGLQDFREDRGDGLAVIGSRGKNYLLELGYSLHASFAGISDSIQREQIHAVKDFVTKQLLEMRFGGVQVVYPHFHSISHQSVKKFDLFPCTAIPLERKRALNREEHFIVESPLDAMISYLAELWASERLHAIFLHSKLSELAARSLYLEETEQDLESEKKKLNLLYFRRVHEELDQNIREVVAARSLTEIL